MGERQGEPPVRKRASPRRGNVFAVAPPADDDARRRHVISAAELVFLSKGYYLARMDDIAAAATMSKRTIYQMFASKEALFEALLVDRMPPPRQCELNSSRPLDVAIADLLLDCALWILSPESVAITRLIMGEYSHSPELGRLMKRQGYKRFVATLEQGLALLEATGRYHFDDLAAAAKMLIGMVVGDFHYELLIGVGRPVGKATIKRRVLLALAIFLTGARTEAVAIG